MSSEFGIENGAKKQAGDQKETKNCLCEAITKRLQTQCVSKTQVSSQYQTSNCATTLEEPHTEIKPTNTISKYQDQAIYLDTYNDNIYFVEES